MSVDLIVEVASNHGGDVELAKDFIHEFARVGATHIKFQTTRVKHLRTDDPQYDWFAKAELSDAAFRELKAECETAGVQFLTTVYHPDEVPFVKGLGCEAIKVGSGECGNWALAAAIGRAGFSRVLVGSGLLQPESDGHPFQHILHVEYLRCLTQYPARHEWAAAELAKGFTKKTRGWSDHCQGIAAVADAVSRGASVVEVHGCLPNQARAKQPWEKTIAEVRQIRDLIATGPVARFVGRWAGNDGPPHRGGPAHNDTGRGVVQAEQLSRSVGKVQAA